MPKEILTSSERHWHRFDNVISVNCLPAVRAHFADLQAGEEHDRELKLIVLGNARVGKSSILKRLIHNTFDPQEPSTHAIRLESWPMKCGDESVQINVWDFGGQDIYRNTHRLFLRSRALFLVVWDKETETQPSYQEDGFTFGHEPLKYWLDYVEDVAPGAPVIVVENKCDDGRGPSVTVPGIRGRRWTSVRKRVTTGRRSWH